MLPDSMRQQLREELHCPVLKRLAFVKILFKIESDTVHRLCHVAVAETSHLTLDSIFSIGAKAERVYFVTSGAADYIHQEHSRVSARIRALIDDDNAVILRPSMWCCEPALWLDWTHWGNLVARTLVELITLDVHIFRKVRVGCVSGA